MIARGKFASVCGKFVCAFLQPVTELLVCVDWLRRHSIAIPYLLKTGLLGFLTASMRRNARDCISSACAPPYVCGLIVDKHPQNVSAKLSNLCKVKEVRNTCNTKQTCATTSDRVWDPQVTHR